MLRQITAFMNCTALFFLAQGASAQRCEPGILESPTKSLTLLKTGETESEDPACIDSALHGLRGTKTPEAINILIKYLDFRRPVYPWEGTSRHHLITVSDLYPAIDSLYSARDSAVPVIVSMIATGQGSELARHNGLVALLLISQRNKSKTAALLKNIAFNSSDAQQTARLLDASNKVSDICDIDPRDRCPEQ